MSLFLQVLPIRFFAPASTQSNGHATSSYLALGVEKEMFGEKRYCKAVNNNWLICFTLIDGIDSAGSSEKKLAGGKLMRYDAEI